MLGRKLFSISCSSTLKRTKNGVTILAHLASRNYYQKYDNPSFPKEIFDMMSLDDYKSLSYNKSMIF